MKLHATVFAAAIAAAPLVAMAGVTPPSADALVGADGSSGGYNGRVVQGGVAPGSVASMSLVMIDALEHSASVNMGGEFNVTRGGTFTNIGANRNGGGNILASWDEVIQGNNVFINAVFRTSDGSMFMPPTATINGQPAFFWTWHFGTANPVDWNPGMTAVNLLSARIFFSDNGGQSFNSFNNIAGLGGSFLPGRDNGNYLATIGDGTNYVMLQYQIQPIPAPAGLAGVLGGALLVSCRRRR